eukprot:5523088-Amphidinium_carterae.1
MAKPLQGPRASHAAFGCERAGKLLKVSNPIATIACQFTVADPHSCPRLAIARVHAPQRLRVLSGVWRNWNQTNTTCLQSSGTR